MVGAALGALGSVVGPMNNTIYGIAVASLGTLCVVREVLRPSSGLLQLRRQTRGRWTKTRNPSISALLWGIDIGFVLTTWMTFSGGWFVVALALFSCSPVYGALIVLAYWGGRSLSVWLAPMMAVDAVHVPDLMNTLRSSRRRVQHIHALVLVICVGVVVLGLSSGGGLLR